MVTLLKKIEGKRLILGSTSPRRKELLTKLGLTFEVRPMPLEKEIYPPEMEVRAVPEFLARQKAASVLAKLETDDVLITADTLVVLDGIALGKPSDEANAKKMLERLSGREHYVITGVSITTLQRQHSFSSESKVFFSHLKEDDINYYIRHYNPLDKAGAYGIQDWIGLVGVERIEGSFFNVMGLPVQRLYQELYKFLSL